ncbi:MAG: hypothetical protein ACUVUF_07870 [Candidatus Bathycorpusculaceae bacterium]
MAKVVEKHVIYQRKIIEETPRMSSEKSYICTATNQNGDSKMKVMEIKVKDEIREEFQKFISRLLRELPAQNIRCVTNNGLYSLPLPDIINENLVRERIVQRYGSKVKIRIVDKREANKITKLKKEGIT